MGQSPSNHRKCYGCPHHHHHHHHQYQYHPTFPPPPPPLPPLYNLYGNPVRFFPTEPYSNAIQAAGLTGPWAYPSSSSSGSSVENGGQDEHQKAKRIRNVVNVHRDSIQIEPDEQNPAHSLVSFVFDAIVDGSFTIFYFAKEGANCSFSLMYPEIYMPITLPFQKGVGQKFCQPTGSGINLGFFGSEELSAPLHGDIFPLVVYAGASSSHLPTDESAGHQPTARGCAQITEAVIRSSSDGSFRVNVIKQILWLDGNRYELQEIFDLDDGDGDGNPEKECVICMSEPTDTAVLPCRHMCMCIGCAKELRLQSNRCPICRQPIEKLMEIPN